MAMPLREIQKPAPGEQVENSTPSNLSMPSNAPDHGHQINARVNDNGDDVQGQSQASGGRPQSFAKEIFFVAVICCSQLFTQAGLALSVAPQRIIARSFGIENQAGKISWFTAGYSLTVGTFILIAGRLGDVFGHKRFFIGGFAWFGLWSALAGFAVYSGPIFFAFCRAMQGIGPAFLLPNSIAILGRSYEQGPRQNMVFSLFGATAPGGFVLGAVFSSLLSQRVWWPWAYWVMCFACILLALLGIFAIPTTASLPDPELQDSSVWQRVDILGAITGVAALVLFNFAWNQGPVVGWPTPYTYIILILGLILFFVFVFIEKRVRHPLIPFGVLRSDSFFTLACVSAGWSSFGIFIYYTWNFLLVYRRQTALDTSAQFAPVAISGLVAAITTGIILARFRPSTVMMISMAAFLTGGTLLATSPINQTYWAQTFVGIVILPWGMDMSFPAATIVLSRAMPRQHQGLAASLVNTFVNYSISIGLGFAGTVDSQVNDGGKSILRGYRGALYMGIGLSGLGVVVALIFCFVESHLGRASRSMDEEQEQEQDDKEHV